MSKAELEKEFQKEQDFYESQEWVRPKDVEKEKDEIISAAAFNSVKKKSINIRPLEADIRRIKVKALEKWIPYQTLINSLIHQYATWKIQV